MHGHNPQHLFLGLVLRLMGRGEASDGHNNMSHMDREFALIAVAVGRSGFRPRPASEFWPHVRQRAWLGVP
jgi:hypothetical protein